MKVEERIKKKPQDFIVEEIPKIQLLPEGDYQVYRLDKSGLSTLQVIRFLSGLYRFKPSEIGFAGLKDKVAITSQYITVPSTQKLPEEECYRYKGGKFIKQDSINLKKETGFCIKREGFSKEPLSLGEIKGNRFTVKVLTGKEEREKLYQNIQQVKAYGCPNYFGEQRFGSVKGRNDFIFLHLLKGKFEQALKTYFSIKGSLSNWGNWESFYRDFRGKVEQYEKDLILGLKRGLSYEKAFRILPKNIRLMFNFAFQSYLWNEYLRKYIEARYPYLSVPFMEGWKLSFHTKADDVEYLKELKIPYTGKEYPVKDPLLKKIIDQTLKESGIKPEDFGREIGGIQVLTDGLRNAVFFPEGLKVVEKTRKSVTLSFTLPAGSYATILIRRLLV
ncbi:MAG: tRNA pseudouridine(13) synthase TruD [Aquificae bacterium]|nr:tRNA pseudouridine(13) synthase TruD [Aquificota bacterium]